MSLVNANGNLFEMKTIQASAFRTLIEALKEILTEANLEFDSTGIKIMAMDETHTVLVHLRLHADRFNEYFCSAKHVLGINMIYFFNGDAGLRKAIPYRLDWKSGPMLYSTKTLFFCGCCGAPLPRAVVATENMAGLSKLAYIDGVIDTKLPICVPPSSL
jgi:hypothetical protein